MYKIGNSTYYNENKYRTIIQHSIARQIERLYNTLPYRLQNIRNIKTEMFKKHLDRWLSYKPDTPKIDNFRAMISAEANSITKQKNNKK